MNSQLTLLQRGVLQRLGDLGYDHIVPGIRELWLAGLRLSDETLSGFRKMPDDDLRALMGDLERANTQAMR